MGKNLTTIINAVEQKLQDTGNAVWSTAEIGAVIHMEALGEFSELSPYPVREVVTSGTVRDIDISSISDRIEARFPGGIRNVEFPVLKEPKRFREFSVEGVTLTIDIDFQPSSGETVYLHCAKSHHLDPDWEKSTPAAGSFVAPTTQTGKRYECTTAGTTAGAGTEPSWPTTAGETVTDGAAVWTCRAEDSTTLDDPSLVRVFVDFVAAKVAISKARSTVSVSTPLYTWARDLQRKALIDLDNRESGDFNWAIERLKGR